ncbi:hypothetical protein Tco_1556070 [Tanacetum coccineum]
MSKGNAIIAINLDTSSDNISSDSDNNTSDSASTSQTNTSEDIDYDFPEYKGPPKSLLKWYGYLSNEYKDNDRFWGSKSGGNESDAKPSFSDISEAKAYSSDDKKGPSKASVPIFERPSVQVLLDHYGYNDIEEYLSWELLTNTTGKHQTRISLDEDCIHESNYAMSKGKYVPVLQKHNLKVKSHVPVTGCVLGLANVTTWDEFVNKMGVRKSEIRADKAKRKRKVSYGS